MKVLNRLFGYRCSYFDVFVMGLSTMVGGYFGYWIGFGVLMVLAAVSAALSLYVAGDRP